MLSEQLQKQIMRDAAQELEVILLKHNADLSLRHIALLKSAIHLLRSQSVSRVLKH